MHWCFTVLWNYLIILMGYKYNYGRGKTNSCSIHQEPIFGGGRSRRAGDVNRTRKKKKLKDESGLSDDDQFMNPIDEWLDLDCCVLEVIWEKWALFPSENTLYFSKHQTIEDKSLINREKCLLKLNWSS